MIGIKVKTDGKYAYVTMNYRHIVENDWLDDLKYLCEPTMFHKKRYTVKFITNIQVYKEFTRHRVFSYAIESTRYCNYSKSKFGGELTFISPCWLNLPEGNYKHLEQDGFLVWGCNGEYLNTQTNYPGADLILSSFKRTEDYYNRLINEYGWKPQEAATILPQDTKAEVIMTGFEEDWCHFFALRALGTTGAPHPQAAELAKPLMEEFSKRGYIR